MSYLRSVVFLASIYAAMGWQEVAAQDQEATCVSQYFANPDSTNPVDSTSKSAEAMIRQVAESFNLVGSVVVIPCMLVTNAKAYIRVRCNGDTSCAAEQDGVPPGEYILYDPKWFRQTVGLDTMQGVWIFGHELAHILNRDFLHRKDETQSIQEERADSWGGCAVAKMGGDRKTLDGIVYKLRLDTDDPDGYPNRQKSLELSQAGFDRCSDKKPAPNPVTVTYKVCSGEYENRCQTHDVYLYCYDDVSAWAQKRCGTSKLQRLNTYGGNKCGYSIDMVLCTDPK